MELAYILLAAGLLFLLSFANGANDVSKAIATLAGARLTSLQNAVLWGTLWTVAGSLSGLYLGQAIIKNISSSIYIDNGIFNGPHATATILAPAIWVLISTWRKWPVSTTHSVVGGLIGAGLIPLGFAGINWPTLMQKIALPLLASPFMAIALAIAFTPFLEKIAHYISGTRVCLAPTPKFILARNGQTNEVLDDCLFCDENSLRGRLTSGITLNVDHLHYLTSGLLSFSRGLNDSPKLIAIALPFLMLDVQVAPHWMYALTAIAMGAGSYLAGKRITRVLGFEVTQMNHAQGFAANLISTFLVMGASRLGMPVSTTHVSSSSIMGLGLTNGRGLNKKTVTSILLAWAVTLPASCLLGLFIYCLLT